MIVDRRVLAVPLPDAVAPCSAGAPSPKFEYQSPEAARVESTALLKKGGGPRGPCQRREARPRTAPYRRDTQLGMVPCVVNVSPLQESGSASRAAREMIMSSREPIPAARNSSKTASLITSNQ